MASVVGFLFLIDLVRLRKMESMRTDFAHPYSISIYGQLLYGDCATADGAKYISISEIWPKTIDFTCLSPVLSEICSLAPKK